MNDPLGSTLLDGRNSLLEALFSLIFRVAGHCIPHFLDGLFDPCLITHISQSFDFVLFRPFKG